MSRAAPIPMIAVYFAVACATVTVSGCDSGADTRANDPPDPPPAVDTQAPSAPESLTVTVISSTRIDLSWAAATDNVGVSGYRIYRNADTVALATVTNTSYSDTSVTAQTEYSYVVRAIDAAGNQSPASSAATGTTPPTEPPLESGLDERPVNTTCVAWERPGTDGLISLTRFTSLSFAEPIGLLQIPGDDARWFVVQQRGEVRQFDAANPTTTRLFIDISDRIGSGYEMGLLGMAFHPSFPDDPRVFLSYTTPSPIVSRISAFVSDDGGATLDPDSEQILLQIEQPEDNHNGGHIAFGPDGFLYIGIGDGGGGGDQHGPTGNGQRLTTMLGKMLRIGIDSQAPYTIPASNPFATNAVCPAAGRASGACPEIFAWGFRNPWRWSFDRQGGELWVGDVGQGAWEEVNRVSLGGNYGWRCREGAHDYNSGTPGCAAAALIDPVTEYGRALGQSITGGYVYRGAQPTNLRGRYLFADYGSGRIFAWLPENATEPREPTVLLSSGRNISSFGEGNDGELYVVDHAGTLHRILFSPDSGPAAPATLSATGCVSGGDARQPAAGLIAYDINAPFWSDGAQKERWLALPEGQTITAAADGDWEFPVGSVLMKHFRLDSRLVETRLFMRHPDGRWGGFTYEWNETQTDATLLTGGAQREIAGHPWWFPSETQCLECHTEAAGRALGPTTPQLNREHTYALTGRTANQLFTLSEIGVLTPPITAPSSAHSVPSLDDSSAAIEQRARAYLDTNCAQCHRPGGPTPSDMDLRYTTALSQMNACDVVPQQGDLGLGADARLILPGDASSSVIVNRMDRRDEHGMPPLGSNLVDSNGVALVGQWVDSLSSCQ